MPERLRTQLSSKYAPENPKLFEFKSRVEAGGVSVSYPIGDEIIGYEEEFAITVPHEAELPFYSSEVRFLRNVKHNPVHIVYNINGAENGYIGESTSIETAYAMLYDKPIVLLRDPVFSRTVPDVIKSIIEKRIQQVPVIALDTYGPEAIADYLESLSKERIDYNLSKREKELLMKEIIRLCRDYKESWQAYKDKRNSSENR